MILIQCGTERSRIGRGSTKFVLIGVGVVQIVVVKILLLAPDAPNGVGQPSKQQSASDTAHNTSNGGFRTATHSRAATLVSSIGQRSWVDAGSNRDDAAACAGEMHSAT